MDVRGDRFEHGEQETVDVEVTCRALTDAVSATSSSRIGPSRSTSRSPGPQHLHRIGVELGGEVAGRVLSVIDSADDGVVGVADDRDVSRPRRLVAGGAWSSG